MNQAFNTENFVRIFYEENRKGNYLEDKFTDLFKQTKKHTRHIIKINELIKKERIKYTNKNIKKSDFYSFLSKAQKIKKIASTKRHDSIITAMTKLENQALEKAIQIDLKKVKKIYGKDVYSVNDNAPLTYFILKQVTLNLSQIFDIEFISRKEIFNQLISVLKGKLYKYIYRVDISSFFESIPHENLIEKIDSNHHLSPSSKKIVKKLLNSYTQLSLSNKGIPRGVGISSYLADIYMHEIV